MSPRARTLVLDLAPGVALAAFLVVITTLIAEHPRDARALDALAYVALVVAGLALCARRRAPLAGYVVALAALIVYVAREYAGGPIFVAPFIALLAVVAAREPRTWIPAAIGGAAAVTVAHVAAQGLEPWVLVAPIAWVAGAFLFAEPIRQRREGERRRDEEHRRALADERLSIARDVHDVVSHSLATISLQAGVAEHLVESRPEQMREAVSAIRRLSREALAELRVVLDALRDVDAPAPRAPAPNLRAVAGLVDGVRGAGLAVDLEVSDDDGPVPDVVAAAGYRIVQEALTNVVRHAGLKAHAHVRLAREPGAVEVEVVDDGPGPPPTIVDGSGLNGMRDRATALGGRFEAGPRPGGGFRVWAWLPAGR
jgi:signal transduction histidine kinase